MSRRTRIRLPDGSERVALDMDFNVKNEEWNEYSLDDGATVRLKTPVIRIFRLLDDGGEPSFTDEGEPELFVWQNTTAMRPGTVQATLVDTAPEQTSEDSEDTFPPPTPVPLHRTISHPAAAASPARVTPRPAYGGTTEKLTSPQDKPRNIFLVWLIATMRLAYSSLRHPGHPVVIDRRTGNVWLKHD